MQQSISPAWFILFIPCFGLMWCILCASLSRIGGWGEFSAKFPANDKIEGKKFNFVSGWFGVSTASPWHAISYRSVLSLIIGEQGFKLSTYFLFRFFHPPIFIPWSDVVSIEQRKFVFWKYSQIFVSDVNRKIGLYGKPGQALFDAYNSRS